MSVIFSPVIGMRGSFIMRIERRPSSVRISVVPAIVPAVHKAVFPSIFVSLSLKTATAIPKKRTGRRK